MRILQAKLKKRKSNLDSLTSRLDFLMSNLVEVSGMVCDNSGESCEFTYVNEDCITHGKCRNCYSGYSKHQLNILNDFDNLRDGHADEQFRLLLRKGVYPYEYVLSWDKFKEMKLPPEEEFHSKLNMSDIGDYDYEHTQKVWKEFKLKNLGEYHDLYLKTDVLLLSNVFETFRNTCLEHKFDPTHFYTLPGLSWQACLKKRVFG